MIRLERYEKPPVEVKNEKLMFRIIRASFNQRRKTLVNGLKNSQEIPFSKEQIEAGVGDVWTFPECQRRSTDTGTVCTAGKCIYRNFIKR